MIRAVLQLWEESEKNNNRPCGCSIHSDLQSRDKYLKSIYSGRNKVPEYYERAIGEPIDVLLKSNLIKGLETVKLMRHEMNNLLNLNEILVI
jgi:hypothetical protein